MPQPTPTAYHSLRTYRDGASTRGAGGPPAPGGKRHLGRDALMLHTFPARHRETPRRRLGVKSTPGRNKRGSLAFFL